MFMPRVDVMALQNIIETALHRGKIPRSIIFCREGNHICKLPRISRCGKHNILIVDIVIFFNENKFFI